MERPGGTEINWDGKQTHKMKLKMNSKPRGEGIPSRSETKPNRESNPWGGGMGMDINWAGIKSGIEPPGWTKRNGYQLGRAVDSPTRIETTDGKPTHQMEPEVKWNAPGERRSTGTVSKPTK
jgi:hypothetical protein